MNEKDQISMICSLIILRISYKIPMSSSFGYRNIFLNSLGIIINEEELIEELYDMELIKHEGLFENSKFYKNISTTEKGKKYFCDNINRINISNNQYTDEIKLYLGLKQN